MQNDQRGFVKSNIRKLISKEDPRRPLSDQKIVDMLKTGGIDIARGRIRDNLDNGAFGI